MLGLASSWKGDRLQTPNAVADVEGDNILELTRWNTVASVLGSQLHVPEVTLALQLTQLLMGT